MARDDGRRGCQSVSAARASSKAPAPLPAKTSAMFADDGSDDDAPATKPAAPAAKAATRTTGNPDVKREVEELRKKQDKWLLALYLLMKLIR